VGSKRTGQTQLPEIESILGSIDDDDYRSETARHLFSIDKLLGAAFEMMKQEPSVEQSVFEQCRQLRVRIRYALSAAIAKDSNGEEIPAIAPSLWKDRLDKSEDPISFTKRIYSKWIGKNLSRTDVKRLDKQLYAAIYNLDNPNDRLDQIGLLKKRQINDLLLSKAGKLKRPPKLKRMFELSPEEQENARLYYLARRRKKPKK
jgi:hypothetical protein